MMKIKNSFLTAIILLAISGGSAYAMPTGGNVTMGDVTNVANPAEIMTANANSIINWDSFSVGVGEKVTFDTQKFMVLNRVIGGQESQILGMLSDQGEGKLILINPSGIVLGENAVINANDLVLSTMRLSDSEFRDLANGNIATFEDTYNDRGKIEIKSGANLTLNEALRLYGGKITIADGVEIISKENSSANVQISAGIKEITNLKGYSNTNTLGSNIEIGDADIGTMANPISNITIKGEKTTLDKTDIVVKGDNNAQHNIVIASDITNINSSKLLNRSGDIFIANIKEGSWSYGSDGSIKKFEAIADPNYEVAIRNSNINTEKAKDITIIGGNVTLDHSQLNSGKDIFVGAVKNYDSKDGVRTATTYENSVINADKDTIVHARGYAEAYGANLNIQAKKFDNVIDSTNPFVKILGEKGISLDDIASFLKEYPEYEDTIADILYSKYQNKYDVKEIKDEKGNDDPRLEKIIEFKNKIENEKEKAKLLEREKRIAVGIVNIDSLNEEEKKKEAKELKDSYKKLSVGVDTILGDLFDAVSVLNIDGVSEISSMIKELMEMNVSAMNPDDLSPTSQSMDVISKELKVINELNNMFGKLPVETRLKVLGNPKLRGAIAGLSGLAGAGSAYITLAEEWNDASFDKKASGILNVVYESVSGTKGVMEAVNPIEAISPKSMILGASLGLIKGGVQYFESVDKYKADGSLSTNDKINIGIETVAATTKATLKEITHGLDDLLLGYDYEDKIVEKAENISWMVALAIDLKDIWIPEVHKLAFHK